MRTAEEIRYVLGRLGQESDPDSEEIPALDWSADTFKFGYLMGKLTALGWVLGEAPGSEMGAHFDYEDWRRAEQETGAALREHFGEKPSPPDPTEDQGEDWKVGE